MFGRARASSESSKPTAEAAQRVNEALTSTIVALQAEVQDLRAQLRGSHRVVPKVDQASAESEELGQCAICMETCHLAATGSCNHHFCLLCLLEYTASAVHSDAEFHNERERPLCPKCREPILAIRQDPEFDVLLHAAGLVDDADGDHASRRRETALKLALHRLTLRMPHGTRVGITVSKWKHGPGVRVKEVVKGEQADQCGILVGDVIVHFNNAPCRHPEMLTSYMDALTKAQTDETAVLLLLPRKGGPEAQPGYRAVHVT